MKIYKVISSGGRFNEDGTYTHAITKDIHKAVWVAQRVFLQRLDYLTYRDVRYGKTFKLPILEADVDTDSRWAEEFLNDTDVEVLLDELTENGVEIDWHAIAEMRCLE